MSLRARVGITSVIVASTCAVVFVYVQAGDVPREETVSDGRTDLLAGIPQGEVDGPGVPFTEPAGKLGDADLSSLESDQPEELAVEGNALSADRLRFVDDELAFGNFIDRLKSVPEGVENLGIYRAALEEHSLVREGRISLTDFGCGARICAVTAQAFDSDTLAAFGARELSFGSREPRIYVMFIQDFVLGNGMSERRMVFSVSPEIVSAVQSVRESGSH